MKKLLLDVHMAEVYSTLKKDTAYKAGEKNMDSLAVYYRDVLAHYNLTPEQFSENLEWYQNHPEDLDTVYNDIIPVATGMQNVALPAKSSGIGPAIPNLPSRDLPRRSK